MGAGKVARQLGSLALSDGIWFPEPTRWLITIYNFSSKGTNAGTRHTQGAYTYMQVQYLYI